MSSQSIHRRILELEGRMQAAAAAEDFEAAALLRNQIVELKGQQVRLPPPGQMGLGTNIPVAEPPKGWKPPRKPDLMTNVSKGRRR